MAKRTNKMICPKCGGEMNHHADKLIHPTTVEEARNINQAVGGVIEEMHCCPGCGTAASRRVS